MKLKKKTATYLLFGLVIIGSILRIYGLGEKSLNVDELRSVEDSENVIWWSGHMPLFLYMLHFLMYIGTTEFVLRLPAAIFGVLTIFLSFKIGKLFFGTKEGLVCAWLISMSNMHIYYSQQVRMYSLLAFLSLLSLFFFKSFLEKNDDVNWHGFILSTLLSLFTHHLAVFVILVEIVFFVLVLMNNTILTKEKSSKLHKRTFLLFVFGIIIIFVLSLPIIITRFTLVEQIFSSTQTVFDSNIVPEFPSMQYLSFLLGVFGWFSNGSLHVFYMFLLFFLFGIIFSIRRFKESIILLLLWVTLPIILLRLLSTYFEFRLGARYLIYVLPIYLILVSRGIVSITETISIEEEEEE